MRLISQNRSDSPICDPISASELFTLLNEIIPSLFTELDKQASSSWGNKT